MGQVEVKGTRAQAVGQFQFSFLLLMRFCKPFTGEQAHTTSVRKCSPLSDA
jgi:hypothetical protein